MVDIVVVGDYVIGPPHFFGQCIGVACGFCRRNVDSHIIFLYGVRMLRHHGRLAFSAFVAQAGSSDLHYSFLLCIVCVCC